MLGEQATLERHVPQIYVIVGIPTYISEVEGKKEQNTNGQNIKQIVNSMPAGYISH